MRRRFGVAPLCIIGCAIALGAARAENPSPAFPLDDVQAGQRGYGLSVFSGSEPERFEAEILGVLRNVSPDTSFILARLTGRNLETTGVVAGMSGSPVYLDGKVAGAVAAAWPFSKEAIALVMPIESMRRLRGSTAPASDGAAAAAMAPGASGGAAGDLEVLRRIASGKLPESLLSERLAKLVPRTPGGATSGLEWSAAGFGERSLGRLREAVGAVSPAGQASVPTVAGAPRELVPGGAVAGVLIDGDLRLAVTGTVTDRAGDEILAFGHPFLDAGPVLLPMAPAEVVTVLASQYSSFKLASFGEPIGAFDEDRAVGVHGRIGVVAPTVPLTVAVGERRFRMRLAALPQLLPTLVAISALGCLDSAGHVAGPQGLDLELRLATRDRGELRLRQSFDGEQAATQSATFLLAVAAFVAQNPLAEVALDGVSIEYSLSARPRTAAIVGAHAERTLVRPGDRVTVNVDFLAYRGAPFRRALEIAVPADLPDGRYSLFVGDGATIDGVRLDLEPAVPQTFAQAMALLGTLHSRRELVALGVFGGRGLAVAGRILPRLPGSVRSLWSAAASGSAVPLRAAIAQQVVEPLEVPAEGGVRIDLEVRHRESPAPGAPGGAREEQPQTSPGAAAAPPAAPREGGR
jgi:hypothetical protein